MSNPQVVICKCLSFSPTSDGSGAAILASEDFVKKHNLQGQAVEILAQALTTDLPSAFKDSCIKMVPCHYTSKQLYNHLSNLL